MPFPFLNQPEFRYIKLGWHSKIPIKGESQSKSPRTYDEIKNHIVRQNYGVIAGHGNLLILDSDNEELTLTIDQDLPETFTVTSSKPFKRHFYFIVSDRPAKDSIKMCCPSNKNTDVGTVRVANSYVVGPGSIHPDGMPYKVSNNVPIQQVAWNVIGQSLSRFILPALPPPPKPQRAYTGKKFDNDQVPIRTVLESYDIPFRLVGGELVSAHPIHGSANGHNLCVNEEKNLWTCRRCCSGGSPTLLIAVLEHIIDCASAVKGQLRGNLFKKTKEIERRKIWKKTSNQ